MTGTHEALPKTRYLAMLGSGRVKPRKLYPAALAIIIFSTIFFLYSSRTPFQHGSNVDLQNSMPIPSSAQTPSPIPIPIPISKSTLSPSPTPSFPTSDDPISSLAQHFLDNPLAGPNYGSIFGELGQRVQNVTQWALQSQKNPTNLPLQQAVEKVTLSMFPFLRNPSKPDDPTPLQSLRSTYKAGSRGIVIPVGSKDFRYAYHLILNLRTVLGSKLMIQVIYAGDEDLPPSLRDPLRDKLSVMGQDIEFLDIVTILDNKSMGLTKDWAIKAFAVLASTFEQVILLDADCVFFQKPEVLFEQEGYKETGALFFHDRLLWQHAFQERHKWWREQMKHQQPSETLLKSKVWTEDYAEEADSGVVVLDKHRLPILMGLLHISWQNTLSVRENITYKITYGDKESWWFGLELCSVPYTFEKHYAAVLGEQRMRSDSVNVCGFTIAHLDEIERLLWYNGSLLKNKAVSGKEFGVPTHWMVDAVWEKGRTKNDLSCMMKGKARELSREEMDVIRRSVELAKKADEEHELV